MLAYVKKIWLTEGVNTCSFFSSRLHCFSYICLIRELSREMSLLNSWQYLVILI